MNPTRQTRLQDLLLATVIAICATTAAFASAANAGGSIMDQHMDTPQLVGKARMKVMLWDVFDAELYTSSGFFDESEPFALRLSYLRSLKGRKIVEKTIDEIQRQQDATADQISQWTKSLNTIIPDVTSGTAITGVRTQTAKTVFYSDNVLIGQIDDPLFTRLFFNIWLGAQSSEQKLRSQLIGNGRQP